MHKKRAPKRRSFLLLKDYERDHFLRDFLPLLMAQVAVKIILKRGFEP